MVAPVSFQALWVLWRTRAGPSGAGLPEGVDVGGAEVVVADVQAACPFDVDQGEAHPFPCLVTGGVAEHMVCQRHRLIYHHQIEGGKSEGRRAIESTWQTMAGDSRRMCSIFRPPRWTNRFASR